MNEEYFDKYQCFKRINEVFNEIIEYRDKTFNEAAEYLSNNYPIIQSVTVQLEPAMENIIEEILKKQKNLFSVKETKETYYEKK